MKNLKYFGYVLKHKWYVFNECRKRGYLWLGLTHDWSKFRRSEWSPYVEKFYGKKIDSNCYNCTSIMGNQCGYNGSGIGDGEQAATCDDYKTKTDEAFGTAWLYHQNRNRHHWQFFTSVSKKGGMTIAEMPEKYVKEMICDWIGAAKAKGQEGIYSMEWYERYKHTIFITDKVRARVEELIYKIEGKK